MTIRRVLVLFVLMAAFFGFARPVAAASPLTAYFFWGDGCPHCAKEETLLAALEERYPELEIRRFEVFHDKDNLARLRRVGTALGADVGGVPFLVVGDQPFSGYTEGAVDRLIEARVAECLELPCPDTVGAVVDGTSEEAELAADAGQDASDQSVVVPIIGTVQLADLSLPALSVVLGTLDGFNPCAMWVLLFLISLLIGMKDRVRMWTLGGAFILASAGVYFLFMSAWLELFLFLGFIAAVRATIGAVALVGGGYSLREFFVNKEATCKVGDATERRRVFDRVKDAVHKRSFLAALAGIILLAFAVNMVELVCSAGFPAVFTQTLAVNDLPRWQYYGYILLYVFFFMLDDLAVFVVSMVTLQVTGLTTKYTRASRLIGGVLMLAIGLMLLFRPEWLMFG